MLLFIETIKSGGMKNIYQKGIGVKQIFVLALIFLCLPGFSQNWYVNDASLVGDVYTSGTGSDINPGTAAQPFATIDTAVARASAGDTIYVDAGDYFEDSVYVIKSLTLRGAKAGIPAGPFAVPLNRSVNETFLTGGIFVAPSIDNVTIDGFTINIVAPNLWGIICRGLNTRVINNMTRATLNIFAIQFGIATRANAPGRLHSYEIKNNHVSGSRYGIFFDGQLDSPSQIFENYVTGTFQAALVLTGSDGHHYMGNVLENNVQGFQIEKGNILIERNTVRNCITNGARLAATPVTAGNTFINNFFENNNTAIRLTEDDAGSVGNSAHYNSFTGNVFDIVSTHSAEFNATCNWFESTDPLVIAAGISGNVRFTPFLFDGTDTDPGLSGFQPNTTCIVVPITLSSFTGYWRGKNARLEWVTQMESNNRVFKIERSLDGRNYSVIGEVVGAGNSQSVRNYSFDDLQAGNIPGYLYYRLKQVDYDGRFSYSNVVLLKNENHGIFTIYPNPVKGIMYIKMHDAPRSAQKYQLYNGIGQVIRNGAVTSDIFSIDAGNLPAGSYLLRITNEKGKLVAQGLALVN